MDLNNLIATIITSTAALVAIIGGFLVSRVVSISSEQNGIKRKLREINNDLVAKREIKLNIENYLFEDDLNDFVTGKNIKRLVFEEKSLEGIIEEDEYTYLTKEQLEPHFEQLKRIVKEMFEIMKKLDAIDTFTNFKEKANGFNYPEREEWYKRVFDAINDEISKSQSNGIFGHLHNFAPINPNAFTPNTDYKDKKRERDRLDDEIRILELQKNAQLELLDNYGKPVWIWSGIAVLIYASIVGIIYPSTLLPYPADRYNDNLTKWFLLGLFYSQLISLFIYLSIAMYKLTNKDEV
ncbi:hypothetical protein [Mesobacillus thioparans]|uniref:hypothetical protein n=1 Tax=Mesobacillus thioparans TaxID=370439 RepID=UPI0039F0E2AE